MYIMSAKSKFQSKWIHENVKSFNVARINRTSALIASDRIAICLKQKINYTEIKLNPLNIDIEAINVLVISHQREIYICNVHIPDNHQLEEAELVVDLIQLLSKSFLLVRNFSSRNTMRSCTNTDTRRKIIENILHKSKISLLNTIEYTHFDMPNGSFSSMDLAFCNPSLLNIIEYSTSSDLYNRNHFARFYNPAKRQI